MRANRATRVARWQVLALLTVTGVCVPPPGREVVTAATGSLDASFGNGGIVITAVSVHRSVLYDLALQADGRIVAAGRVDGPDNAGTIDFALVRYEPDGSLDATFGNGGIVRTDFDNGIDEAFDLAVQPDGRLVAVGHSDLISGSRSVIARYNTDGTLDATFGSGGKVLASFPVRASSLLLQPDGAIVIASSYQSNTGADFALARYHADGSLDTSFGVDGRVITDFTGNQESVAALALYDDGRIAAVGGSGLTGFELARYLPDGSLDPSFGGDGKVLTNIHNHSGAAEDLAIQADGKLVAVGRANGYQTSADFYLVRYNLDGSLDPSFDGDGKVITDFAGFADYGNAMAIDGVGRIVLAGFAGAGPGIDRELALARYNADGSLDAAFGSGGRMTTELSPGEDAIDAVLLQPDGKIVAGGRTNVRGTSDFVLARYDGGIPHASAFFPHATDAPPATSDRVMTSAPPTAQPLSVAATSVTWLSEPAVTGTFPLDTHVPARATFRFVTPCTQASSRGKTVSLASTNLAGGDEQPLGTGQSSGSCGRTEVIEIPVAGIVTLTNRRLKVTVSSPGGVHLQLGPRTFLSALTFEEGQWATADISPSDVATAALLQPDGKLLVAGNVRVRSVHDLALARFDGGQP